MAVTEKQTALDPASHEGSAGDTIASALLAMTPESFAGSFRGSPMKRAKLSGLQRNAAVVLKNGTSPDNDMP